MPEKTFLFVHDIVEENGKTVRENNLEKKHNIPIGSLVEIKDSRERLYVCQQIRDCDGTPLYSLCMKDDLALDFEDILNRIHSSWDGGYSEENLKIIEE